MRGQQNGLKTMIDAIGENCHKFVMHVRRGTLLARIRQALTGRQARPAADPDHYHGDVAQGYLAKRLQQKSWHIEQQIVQRMLAAMPDGGRVLDVPFGTGRFVDMFLAKKMQIWGVDISADMLAAARDALGANYERCQLHQGGADELPYEDNHFDLVVCFRFFGLISFELAERVLAEIRRVARDQVIVRVPVRAHAQTRRAAPQPHESVQGQLLEEELVAMFARHSFVIEEHALIEEKDQVLYKVYRLRKKA
jgi:SAM-dependent methyltransferase